MGPRPFSRGNLTAAVEQVCYNAVRFNGATTFQPWKPRSRSCQNSISSGSFNGATTFQPWKLGVRLKRRKQVDGSLELQWGHDLSAVETDVLTVRSNVGPSLLQWGHDLSAVETVVLSCLTCQARPSGFNGATTFQPWKRANPKISV